MVGLGVGGGGGVRGLGRCRRKGQQPQSFQTPGRGWGCSAAGSCFSGGPLSKVRPSEPEWLAQGRREPLLSPESHKEEMNFSVTSRDWNGKRRKSPRGPEAATKGPGECSSLNSTPSFTISTVTLGMLLNFSEPLFLDLWGFLGE